MRHDSPHTEIFNMLLVLIDTSSTSLFSSDSQAGSEEEMRHLTWKAELWNRSESFEFVEVRVSVVRGKKGASRVGREDGIGNT